MSDKLKDLHPIQISFDPGERVTDTKLDAWANQIELGFYHVEKLLGDLYHDQETDLEATYFTNLARGLGNMGKAQHHLPTREQFQYRQELIPGQKKILLDYTPYVAGGNLDNAFADSAAQNKAITNNGTVDPDTLNAGGVTTIGDNQWFLEGRYLYTDTLTAAETTSGNTIEYVQYTVNGPNGAANPIHYGDLESGPNLVPSLEQIRVNKSGGNFKSKLCTIAVNAGVWTITLPEITYFKDENGASKSFQWVNDTNSGAVVLPRYNLPGYFSSGSGLDLDAAIDKTIPSGLVQIWSIAYDNVTDLPKTITQVKPTTQDRITFAYVNDTQITATFPASMSVPEVVGGDLTNKYVLAIAGQGVTSFIRKAFDAVLKHKHDGSDETQLLDHNKFRNTFNGSIWTHPRAVNNAHPQYLRRVGYTTDEPHNAHNSMVGDLHLGSKKANPASQATLTGANAIDFAANDSYKLLIGPTSNTETQKRGIYFDTTADSVRINHNRVDGGLWITDDEQRGGNSWENCAKIYLGGKTNDANVRDLFMFAKPSTALLDFDSVQSDNNVAIAAGVFVAKQNIIYFNADPYADAAQPWQGSNVDLPSATATYLQFVEGNNAEVANTGTYGELHFKVQDNEQLGALKVTKVDTTLGEGYRAADYYLNRRSNNSASYLERATGRNVPRANDGLTGAHVSTSDIWLGSEPDPGDEDNVANTYKPGHFGQQGSIYFGSQSLHVSKFINPSEFSMMKTSGFGNSVAERVNITSGFGSGTTGPRIEITAVPAQNDTYPYKFMVPMNDLPNGARIRHFTLLMYLHAKHKVRFNWFMRNFGQRDGVAGDDLDIIQKGDFLFSDTTGIGPGPIIPPARRPQFVAPSDWTGLALGNGSIRAEMMIKQEPAFVLLNSTEDCDTDYVTIGDLGAAAPLGYARLECTVKITTTVGGVEKNIYQIADGGPWPNPVYCNQGARDQYLLVDVAVANAGATGTSYIYGAYVTYDMMFMRHV